MDTIYVTGHRNPDTDSVVSAMAYAALRNSLGDREYTAACLGRGNDETQAVLDRFQFKPPMLLKNVRTQVCDLKYDTPPLLNSGVTISRAWHVIHQDTNISAIPVTNEDGTLFGMLSAGDIAAYDMSSVRNPQISNIPLYNLLSVIEGKVLNDAGEQVDNVCGEVTIALPASCKNLLFDSKNSIVICGDQPDMIRYAMELGVQCLIVCQAEVSEELRALKTETCLISTPFDAYRTVRLICHSLPVSRICKTENMVSFHLDDYIDDVRETVLKSRFRCYPILDENEQVVGTLSRFHLLRPTRKRVVLVDHNELAQAVRGLEQADILEIIDHHRLADIQTGNPIFVRNEPVGSTTTIVADPHEIVNVCGAQAVQYLLDATENLPLNVYLMLPSSVPATPFETNGADFTAADMAPFMAHPRVLGLGEVMCYPDVLAARQTVLEKLALAADAGKRADGHAPGLSGRELQAYAAAGIRTEHECTTFAEAAEKLRAGLAVLVREGSAAKNLSVLVNGLLDSDLPADRFLFCTDDKHLDDIARDGHLRWNVRQAISLGMKPVTAIKMATWNAAREYGLRDLGAVAAGYRADLVLLDSLKQMTVRAVYKDGRPVEERFAGLAAAPVPDALLHSVHFENVAPADLALPVAGPAHVIEMVPYQIVTRHAVEEVPSENGFFRPNAVYTKLCVVERHGKNGGVAVCPLKGYGITGGAIATSVAHDSHNVIAAGDNDADLALAINHLKEIGGGYVLAGGGKILGALPLRVGGLMSTAPWEEIQAGAGAILERAKAMGIPYHVDPFTSLSFLALPVIPELRLTDRGLFDVTAFSLVKD